MINKKERFVPVLFLLKFWSQPQGLRAWEYRNSDARTRRYSLLTKPSRGSLQIPSLRPRSGAKVTLLHFLFKKFRCKPCSLAFAKSHAWFGCSVVNAFATSHGRYQLFASKLTVFAVKLIKVISKNLYNFIYWEQKKQINIFCQILKGVKFDKNTYLYYH